MARAVRAEAGRQDISQAEIGKAIGKSQGAAWRRLAGLVPFDVEELDKVAGLLGVPATTFFGESERAA